MSEYTEEKYQFISLRDIAELQSIYEDYLYIVRQHEKVFKWENVDDFASKQVECMYQENKNPRKFILPWYITKVDAVEAQEFADYVNNNIEGDGRKTYVSLQHIKPEENNAKAPIFAIPPYNNTTIATELPSLIEEYTLSYPENATLANTEFHIDGRYKAVYLGEKAKYKHISDCINDTEMSTEIAVMLNIGECYRRNGYIDDGKFQRMVVNVYAGEWLLANENNLLELLCSFAGKIEDICHAKYHERYGWNDIKKAKEEGFLNLSDNFVDYVNIRDFIRHQWDTLQDLDNFSLEKSLENKMVRAKRAYSFLKFCDKTIHQRMAYSVEALHDMQRVMTAINPNILIREPSETNNKFKKRIKAVCLQYPDRQIEVEMNYPLASEKYISLCGDLNKKNIFPSIKILDDFDGDIRLGMFEDYRRRSFFLRTYHGIESDAMRYCQRCAQDKNNRGAWFYLRDVGIITNEECQIWQDYTSLRNKLVHDYFSESLRKQLNGIESKYFQGILVMQKRIRQACQDATKIQGNIIEYNHKDGKVVAIDYTSHKREIVNCNDKPPIELEKQEDVSEKNVRKEVYRNGVEFKIENDEIVGVSFPNNVYVNFHNRSINWGDKTCWYTNSDCFNALQTPRSTIRTDKELKVSSIFEGKRNIPFAKGDDLLIDYRHRLSLDGNGRIKEFNFKNAENEVIKTTFRYLLGDKSDIVSFTDGTSIVFASKNVEVIHNNTVLSYGTRKEFVKTYDSSQNRFLDVKKVVKAR